MAAQSVVGPNTGGMSFQISTVEYKSVLNTVHILMDVPSLDATTFNDEPNEASEPGPTRAFFNVSGVLKQGGTNAASGPIMPPPTNVAIASAWGASNTISFTGDFNRCEIFRAAGGIGSISGSGRSRSAIVLAWNRS